MAGDIRAAVGGDSAGVASLDARCRRESWSEHAIHDVIEGNGANWHCYVAVAQGTVEGFVIGRVIGDEAELDAIVVDERTRRRGLGSALLHHYETEVSASGAATVFLEVRERNHAATAFYASRGYERYRRRENYYSDGEDAVCLRRRLECESTG